MLLLARIIECEFIDSDVVIFCCEQALPIHNLSCVTSPTIICNFEAYGVPWTLLFNSAANLGSNSHAITFFALSSNFTVILPVPGPTSSTVSVLLIAAFSMIPFTTSGFFRIC